MSVREEREQRMKEPVTMAALEADCAAAQGKLEEYLQTVDLASEDEMKLMRAYMRWVVLKTDLIGREKAYSLPCAAVPGKVTVHDFMWLKQDKQALFRRYYRQDANGFVLAVKRESIPQADVDVMLHGTVLKRGGVVWVEFGYNIGNEFGGRHPAIILRNNKDSLLVVPLSSQVPSSAAQSVNVTVPNVYGFPKKTRYVNVLRTRWVSILRVDMSSTFGTVKGQVLTEINDRV